MRSAEYCKLFKMSSELSEVWRQKREGMGKLNVFFAGKSIKPEKKHNKELTLNI